MTTSARFLTAAICAATLLCADSLAQANERRPPTSAPRAQEQQQQSPDAQPGAASSDALVNEVSLLRKSLQTLNAMLREISDKLLAPDAKLADVPDTKQSRLASALAILNQTEQRAELLRRQLLEMMEKETFYKNRLVQIDESSRPESIDRTLALVGTTTSTTDLRDTRRRVLDNERSGIQNLLSQTSQSRMRLEDDVKQADALVAKLRQRLLPLIEREIDKINPEEKQ
jgi:glucose/arabinose dehydrogenase